MDERFILIHFSIESGLSNVKRDMCKSYNHPHIHIPHPQTYKFTQKRATCYIINPNNYNMK